MLSVGLQDSDRLSPQNGAAALHMLGNLRHTFLLQVTRSYPPLLVLWISKIPPQTQYIQEAGLNRWQNVSLFPPLCWLWGRLTALYFTSGLHQHFFYPLVSPGKKRLFFVQRLFVLYFKFHWQTWCEGKYKRIHNLLTVQYLALWKMGFSYLPKKKGLKRDKNVQITPKAAGKTTTAVGINT